MVCTKIWTALRKEVWRKKIRSYRQLVWFPNFNEIEIMFLTFQHSSPLDTSDENATSNATK